MGWGGEGGCGSPASCMYECVCVCGMVWYGMAAMLCYAMLRHGMAWHGMAWHGTAWHGMAWHGMALHVCM